MKVKDGAFNDNINQIQSGSGRINQVNCADKYSILNMTGSQVLAGNSSGLLNILNDLHQFSLTGEEEKDQDIKVQAKTKT